MSSLEKAIILATRAHEGQIDKGGNPYILHPLRVMQRVASPEARMAAVLHDVLEDTNVSAEQLVLEGFTAEVVDAVVALSRNADEDYFDFVLRAKRNPIARQVKIADIQDNMDLTRIMNTTAKDMERIAKYEKALKELLAD
ncbi:HD domain-containing protein [Paenibacillus eucommiae]|uniref:(P)ppGpp synthase/HD superfamily hydrolase n=1 Tax=Paenibacillus eucommiae TaxID=1355755 RepID=A0ABS4J924_9BACL|nr:HD domain-containing protein [Paenibacillus eucommiae]MBP1996357.1 (p)ppGpp synthase/HD superfamily hydrolase [Paenibacillus eucommiae]